MWKYIKLLITPFIPYWGNSYLFVSWENKNLRTKSNPSCSDFHINLKSMQFRGKTARNVQPQKFWEPLYYLYLNRN